MRLPALPLLLALVLAVAHSILAGDGFSFSVPSRSAANQLYVPELDRIVLKDKSSLRPYANISTVRKTTITTRILQLIHQLCLKNIHVTKRDLFYTDVKLFQVNPLPYKSEICKNCRNFSKFPFS